MSENDSLLRISAASWRFDEIERLEHEHTLEAEPDHGYWYDEDCKRIKASMAENLDVIVAYAIRGVPSKMIAALFGVSRECIDGRLRAAGFKNPPGVRGRPWPSRFSPPAASQSRVHGPTTVCR